MPITDWLHYADHDLDPICRSSSGSYRPVTDSLDLLVIRGFEFSQLSLGNSQLLSCLGQLALASSQFIPLPIFTFKTAFTKLQKLPLDFCH